MSISAVLSSRRHELGLTLKEVALAVGVSEATVQRWESGNIKNLRQDKIAKLAEALKISPSTLMGWDIPDSIPVTSVQRIPVVGSVYAGVGGIAQADFQGYEPAYNLEGNGDYRYFVVKGDSMSPGIMPGDLALVRLQDDVECGELAVVIVNGEEGLIKRVQKQHGSIVLVSANAAEYPPRVFIGSDMNEVKIWGRVMEVKRKY